MKNAALKVIAGAPYGLSTTHADAINQELLAFLPKKAIAACPWRVSAWRFGVRVHTGRTTAQNAHARSKSR
jgi:hypothetical protein